MPLTSQNHALLILFAFQAAEFSGPLRSNGINRNGIGAKAIAIGGASSADISDTFAATSTNPALLGFTLSDDVAIGIVGVVADATFENGTATRGLLDDRSGAFPEFAVRKALGETLSLGFSLIPEQARVADWVYEDKAGGAEGSTSYGVRAHRSDVLGTRAALSLGWQVSETLSIGAGVGATYNRNGLEAPYTFQSHPALAGFKTLLDLETEGVGANADFGLAWKPADDLTFALTYRTPTRIETEGTARGDISGQLDSLGLSEVPGGFHYEAEVQNTLPDSVTAGLSWQVNEKTRLALQVDWIGWADSFDELTVRLRNGSNRSINRLIGSSSITDTIPLEWDDRLVFRVGMDHEIASDWFLRAGYSYGEAPMPVETTLPMTAAISEHSLGFVVGHVHGPVRIDLAYQIDLPSSRVLSGTRIRSGEYEGSRLNLEAHWIALTLGYDF